MQIHAWKRLSAFPAIHLPLDVRKNSCAKELCIMPHRSMQSKKNVDAEIRLNNGNQALSIELSSMFQSEA
jgi:hypothetical protein